MRKSRPLAGSRFLPRQRQSVRLSKAFALALSFLLLLPALIPSGLIAPSFAPVPSSSQQNAPAAPRVTGADYTLQSSQYRLETFGAGTNGNVAYASDSPETREKSFNGTITLPEGSLAASFTSDPTQAPIDFTDVAPHWWADTPANTSVLVELRTSKDGQAWSPWVETDQEDDIMPSDSLTQTYGSLVSVDQQVRTNRFVQSRITLQTSNKDVSPAFHQLTYTFIDGGVTPSPPQPQVMIQGTPSSVPKPIMVSRLQWGSPDGESSPKWTPKYKRVTNIVIHHTATSNSDTDFAARVRAIWYFHKYTRGWGDIGYNYLIDPNGVIYEGRAGGDDVEAGHAYPFNVGTMGIGMIGTFMTQAPSAAAQASLIDLVSWKVNQRGIDPMASAPVTGYTDCGGSIVYTRPTIAGHRDYEGTACGKAFNTSSCPGDKLWSMLPQIRAAVVSDQPPLRATFTGHDTPGNIEPGATVNVRITVRNSGSLTWPANGQGAVSLGYQWLTPDGKPLKPDGQDTTTPLSRDVPFADTITVTARLKAPTASGRYVILWDMYRDGDGWFNTQGSPQLRVDVVVGKGVGDQQAPTSSVLPLPIYSSNQEILVRWAGQDGAKGSGIVSYDVQYRTSPDGQWTDWQLATAQTQATFDGNDGYTYEFRCRARDAAGNVEQWPDKAQAYTTVDTRPPPLIVGDPEEDAYVPPGPLTVTGQTEPGTFVVVNDKRANEVNGYFTSTLQASGRDFVIHITAADPAGNVSRAELTVQAASRYNDVQMSRPDFLSIESLSDQGIVSGYPDGSFKPDVPLTRAQLAKILAVAMKWSLIKPPQGRFSDVDPTAWMFPYVETAAARGVMAGYDDGTFLPNGGLSRAEAVQSIVLTAGWKPEQPASRAFLDVPVTHWAGAYIETARKHGVIALGEDRAFRPAALATRGAVSVMVDNMLKDLQAHSVPPNLEDGGPQ